MRDLKVGISKDTCMAVFHTSRGLVSLAGHLLCKYSGIVEYVLLGKIQSDRIESFWALAEAVWG